jgi:hypothetical protein
MTLKSQINTDVSAVFLQTDDFGETFVYRPCGGTSREIVGVIVTEQVELTEVRDGKQRKHMLTLFVSRSSTTGIDDPQLGDALWRKSNEDEAYSFAGLADDPDENDGTAYAGQQNAHTLLFVREYLVSKGGNRRQ